MGFMRGKGNTVNPMSQLLQEKIPTVKKVNDIKETLVGDTTQPMDEGKKSKKKDDKKNIGKGGTILTSVTGVNTPAQLGMPTLLGGNY